MSHATILIVDDEQLIRWSLAEREPVDFFSASAAMANGHGRFELPADGVDLEQVERSLVTQALERAD